MSSVIRARNKGDTEKDNLAASLGFVLVIAGAALLFGYTLLFSWGISLAITQFARLATMQDGSSGPFRVWFAAALAAWIVSFTLIYALPADVSQFRLGLPPATAAMFYLLWIFPLLLVTLPYALHFHASNPDEPIQREEDLLRRSGDSVPGAKRDSTPRSNEVHDEDDW